MNHIGHPPISPARRELLTGLAEDIRRRGARRIAIDGVDGAGKTTFARELVVTLREGYGRVLADSHLNPAEVRYRRGRDDPEGFWLDTYDHRSLRKAIDEHERVVVDGLFLHRDELVGLWDFSIFLDVPFHLSVPRMARRDGTSPDPDDPAQRRHVEGQRLYFAACLPWTRATVVIDNRDLGKPVTSRVTPALPRSGDGSTY